MLKNKSKILNVFFMKDLTKLIEKYNNMDKDIVERLEALVAIVIKVMPSNFNKGIGTTRSNAFSLPPETSP